MHTFGTVLPDELEIHDEPGGKFIGGLDKGVRVELAGHAIEHPKATWWKLAGKPGYVAEKNKAGKVFLRIEHIGDMPRVDPDGSWRPNGWLIAAAVAVIALLAAAMRWL